MKKSQLLSGSVIARETDPELVETWAFVVHPLVIGMDAVRTLFKPARIEDVLEWINGWIPQIEKSCSPHTKLTLTSGVDEPNYFDFAGWTTRSGQLYEARFIAYIYRCPPGSRRELEFMGITKAVEQLKQKT